MKPILMAPLIALLVAESNCNTNSVNKPLKERPITGAWHHQSYQEILKSMFFVSMTIRKNKTFVIQETITPIADTEEGVRYILPDSVKSATIEYQGTWSQPSEKMLSITFSAWQLFLDGQAAKSSDDAVTTFFWSFIDIEQGVSYLFPYFFTTDGNLILSFLFKQQSDFPPVYFAFLNKGNGSLFSD